MRQVVLDTETTGLEPDQGHRVIEIGAIEVVDRKKTGRHFHEYMRPDRDVDAAAMEVHGISNDFLADKPAFQNVVEEFLRFVDGAELIIHNAAFDITFLDFELSLLERSDVMADRCQITDSLALARHLHPGQKNSLDALCRRYDVDNSARELHGALLDAEILADVYLLMTGGQTSLFPTEQESMGEEARVLRLPATRRPTRVRHADDAEVSAHEGYLDTLDKKAENGAVWRRAIAANHGASAAP